MDFSIDDIKNIIIKMIDPAEGAFRPAPEGARKGSPARMLVEVLDVKEKEALLQGHKGKFKAKTETPVYKGELLVLDLQQSQGKEQPYRIAARTGIKEALTSQQQQQEQRTTSTGQDYMLWSLSVSVPDREDPYPVMVRYYPQTSRNVPDSKGKKKYLELVVETENLGLVMIQITKKGDGYACEFLVETNEAGKILEKEAYSLLGEAGKTSENGEKPIYWRVSPVKNDIENSFINANILIDTMA